MGNAVQYALLKNEIEVNSDFPRSSYLERKLCHSSLEAETKLYHAFPAADLPTTISLKVKKITERSQSKSKLQRGSTRLAV